MDWFFFLPTVWPEFCCAFIAFSFPSLSVKVNEQTSLEKKKKVSCKIWLDRYDTAIFLIPVSLSVFGVEVKDKGHTFLFNLVC